VVFFLVGYYFFLSSSFGFICNDKSSCKWQCCLFSPKNEIFKDFLSLVWIVFFLAFHGNKIWSLCDSC
jgi:hypothetical protein